MIEQSRFYRAVRQYVVTAPVWAADLLSHEVLPDEQLDLTLVSQRVYGNRNEFLAVMASAGIDRFDQSLQVGSVIRLPNVQRLELIKQSTGFISTATKTVR